MHDLSVLSGMLLCPIRWACDIFTILMGHSRDWTIAGKDFCRGEEQNVTIGRSHSGREPLDMAAV